MVNESLATLKTMSAPRKRTIIGWAFLSPYILVFSAFLFTPLAYAGYLSLHTHKLVGGTRFAPLENYRNVFTDPTFLSGLARVALFALIQVPLMMGLALFGALVSDAWNSRLSKIFRIVAFLPYAVPTVFGGLIWGFLFSTTHGPLPRLLLHLGFHSVNLFTPTSIIYLVGNVVTWGTTGFNMIIIYSALQGLPRDTAESAVIDGANQVQIARYIKIPEVTGAVVLTTIFSVIAATQLYTEPSILGRYTYGINEGYTPNMYAFYLAFSNAQFDYSSAISISLALIVFAVSFGFIFIYRRKLTKK